MAYYRGVSGVARKIIKEYRGVSGVARQIKKEYRGVSGVARLYYSADITYLYKEGDQCKITSGGWSTKYGNKAWSGGASGSTGNPTRATNSDHLLISIPHQSYRYSSNNNMIGSWYTIDTIDLTNYSNLCAEIELTFGDDLFGDTAETRAFFSFGAYSSQYMHFNYSVKSIRSTSTSIGSSLNGIRRTISIDISSVTSSCYILVGLERWLEATNNNSNSIVLKVYNIWLE